MLDSGTKGTGAEMVPLDKVSEEAGSLAGAGLRSAQTSAAADYSTLRDSFAREKKKPGSRPPSIA